MKEAEIHQLVASVLAEIAPEAKLVRDEEDLREALDLDSMDFRSFVAGQDRGSGQPIPEADYPRPFTLRGVPAYLG